MQPMNAFVPANQRLSHLRALEAEAMHILREVVAVMRTPCLFYSIGKDSTALLHVDTGWEFSEMGQFRDRLAARLGLDMRVHINPDGERLNITPFSVGSAKYTDIMKTEALKQALNQYGFDACFGGARRDEEKSRAKERVCSFRDAHQRWDPKQQRPELWQLYNTRINAGESLRVFPLSNWTELDIWQYIHLEGIEIVDLYRAALRPVVELHGPLS